MLEYSQRLRRHTRNVFAAGGRVHRDAALRGGAAGAARRRSDARSARSRSGKRADIVVLDAEHADMTSGTATALDAYVFVAGEALVTNVMVGGETVVTDGRHKHHDGITARYRKTMQALTA